MGVGVCSVNVLDAPELGTSRWLGWKTLCCALPQLRKLLMVFADLWVNREKGNVNR